ncbi:unnamed protein product, partial [Amoebophrya sp. A25]
RRDIVLLADEVEPLWLKSALEGLGAPPPDPDPSLFQQLPREDNEENSEGEEQRDPSIGGRESSTGSHKSSSSGLLSSETIRTDSDVGEHDSVGNTADVGSKTLLGSRSNSPDQSPRHT